MCVRGLCVRVCMRRRWKINDVDLPGLQDLSGLEPPDLPSADLLREQSTWLSPMRARLLRRIAIARRHSVLDLGTGYGAVVPELVRRSGGSVHALDHALDALRSQAFTGAQRVCGDATRLPYADASFDLVYCQCALMWMPESTLDEVARVLQVQGVLVAFEPDYGGMIEHPQAIATRDIWIAALSRTGADPLIGRKLPSRLAALRFDVRVDLLPQIAPPSPMRFDLLRGLPLTGDERVALQSVEAEISSSHDQEWQHIAHLPFVLITAARK